MARRKRSPHPGIVYRKAQPQQNRGAAIRWIDPDTRRQRTAPVPVGLEGAALREWLVRRSQELGARKLALYDGAPALTETPIATCIDRYFVEAVKLRPSSAKMYRLSTRLFVEWSEVARVRTGDDLTTARLRQFRAWLSSRPGRSLVSADRDLATVSAVLNHGRAAGLYARLNRDAIADGLKRFRPKVDRKDFIRPAQCRALLQSALAHDAVEAATGRPRAGAVAPLVACLMLSGVRLGEAVGLTWDDVDLDPQDPVIHLRSKATKTGDARDVDLTVSPGLIAVLRVLKLGKKKGSVFGFTDHAAREAFDRLIQKHDAPKFTAHALRRTAGTALTCAPSIFGAASVFMSARQLGHSVQIAEKHYLGRLKVPAEVRTIEGALRVETEIRAVVQAVLVRGMAEHSRSVVERARVDAEQAMQRIRGAVRI